MAQCEWWTPHDGGLAFCTAEPNHLGPHVSGLGDFADWRPRAPFAFGSSRSDKAQQRPPNPLVAALAEVARLREALEQVLKLAESEESNEQGELDAWHLAHKINRIARAALGRRTK